MQRARKSKRRKVTLFVLVSRQLLYLGSVLSLCFSCFETNGMMLPRNSLCSPSHDMAIVL